MRNRASNKILAFALAATMLLTLAAPSGPMATTAWAAMPVSAAGEPWDGVDFDALIANNSGIYYGTYKHVKALDKGGGTYGNVTDRETDPTPILWRVMGEENGGDNLTLLSEYVLDTHVFNSSYYGGNAQNYARSELHAWLNDTFINSFDTAERTKITDVDTTTGMYDRDSGGPIDGDHYPLYAYKEDGGFVHNNDSTRIVNTGPWPKITNGDKVYLPWGKYNDSSVYWEAGNTGDQSYKLSGSASSLKNGTNAYYWLRSPISDFSAIVLEVDPAGKVHFVDVDYVVGVRPAFKLNPSSIIFVLKSVKMSLRAEQKTMVKIIPLPQAATRITN